MCWCFGDFGLEFPARFLASQNWVYDHVTFYDIKNAYFDTTSRVLACYKPSSTNSLQSMHEFSWYRDENQVAAAPTHPRKDKIPHDPYAKPISRKSDIEPGATAHSISNVVHVRGIVFHSTFLSSERLLVALVLRGLALPGKAKIGSDTGDDDAEEESLLENRPAFVVLNRLRRGVYLIGHAASPLGGAVQV
jgi:hypothetical protein